MIGMIRMGVVHFARRSVVPRVRLPLASQHRVLAAPYSRYKLLAATTPPPLIRSDSETDRLVDEGHRLRETEVDLPRSLRVLQDALEGVDPADSVRRGKILFEIAWTTWKTGDLAGMIAKHKEALAIRIPVLGPTHEDVAWSYSQMGMGQHEYGQYEEAIDSQEKALQIRQTLPTQHFLERSHNALGITYCSQAEVERDRGNEAQATDYLGKAKSRFEEALRILEAKGDGVTPIVLSRTYSNLGMGLVLLGQVDEGIRYQNQALTLRREALPDTHPEIAYSLNHLGTAYREKGDNTRSLEFLNSAHAQLGKRLPAGHVRFSKILANRALTYEKMGDPTQAAANIREAVEAAQGAYREDHPVLLRYLAIQSRIASARL